MKQVSTKKALVASVLSMLVCVSMLIGSTFAWFTDSASTNVNVIKAGNLKVELIKGDTDEELSESLKWVKASGHEDEAVLWEPGATYELESFRIKNGGNLAIKYKIAITGLTGSAKLLEAIDFTVAVEGDETVNTITALDGYEGKLSAGSKTGKITISGHMREDAGNEYMDKEISGISIAVYATQATEEYDSNGNTYDENASYPAEAIVPVKTKTEEGVTKVAEDVTIKSAATVSETPDEPVATATVPADTKLESADVASLKLVIVETDEPDGFTVEGDAKVATYDVSVKGVHAENATAISVKLYVGKSLENVKLYHNGVEMATEDYSYDAASGYITFKTATFSPFTITYTVPAIVADGVAYDKLEDAIAGANGAKIVLNEDVKTKSRYKFSGNIDIDLNGYTWELDNNTGIDNACVMTVSNGKILGAGSSSYIDIRVGANNSATLKFNGVDFENTYKLGSRAGGSSTTYTDYILKYSPSNGSEKLDLSFVGCTFKNAAVKMNGYNNGGEISAIFDDCKFEALTNNSLLGGDFYTTGTVTVKDCAFDVIVTANVTVVSLGKVKATAEGTVTFDGRVAVDELDRAEGSEHPIKLYSEQSVTAGIIGENVVLKGLFAE